MIVTPKEHPQLDLALARKFKHGTMINLDYPGLRLVATNKSGAPLFIVNDFLSGDECERLLAKCSGIFIDSAFGNAGAQRSMVDRTSQHIRIIKSETVGLQSRIAQLTNHDVMNMESGKLIRYEKEKGQQFSKHVDAFEFSGVGRGQPARGRITGTSADVNMIDGSTPPKWVNREITMFIYLNDVPRGGETAFYNGNDVFMTIKPQRGLAVLFYSSLQPPSGVLPDKAEIDKLWHRLHNMIDTNMDHAGLPAVDEKVIYAQWIWPIGVDFDNSLLTHPHQHEARTTDGVPI